MELDKEALLEAIGKCKKQRLIPIDLIHNNEACETTDPNYYKVCFNQSEKQTTSAHPYGSFEESSLELLNSLIEEHLGITTALPPALLSKCQHVVNRPVNLASFVPSRLIDRHNEFSIERDSFGHICGMKETFIVRSSESVSMALSRDYESTNEREFWRGTSDGVPFLPGGMEDNGMEMVGDFDAEVRSQHIQNLSFLQENIERGSGIGREEDDLMCKRLAELAISARPIEQESIIQQSSKSEESAFTGKGTIAKTSWAHVVDANSIPKDFDVVIPELAYKFPFQLDTFQKQAVYHLEKGNCVFVAAHTSAGKTVVAEYAIALAFKHMTKVVYTSPIKALSNQKYRDFKNTFEDVGLLTGDVQIRPDANCLIMTTEILRSMLYKGADILRDVEFVVFDEVHYVNDIDRGHVWEEVIIMLPSHVSLILLSATVPNTVEFADWIGRTKRRDIYVITTLKRPVPLEHHLYLGECCKDFVKIVDQNKQFLVQNYKDAFHLTKKEQKSKKGDKQKYEGKSNNGQREQQTNAEGVDNKDSVEERPRFGDEKRGPPSRNTWIHLIGLLKKKNLLPVVMFTFSKKRCDEYANALTSLNLTNSSEKSTIHVFLNSSLARLSDEDASLPQITRLCELLKSGIAVHHSGILPILKEAVEILFCKGLVKILFATETFAMGVNMPAKTVVFTGTRKHDGHSLRELLPGEYTQMSGRAGRRGLDPTGMVIIFANDIPLDSVLKHMILGAPTKLESQFKLTYNMILNLLRVEALKVEDMMKRSFSENDNQKNKGNVQKNLESSEKALKNAEKLDCKDCSKDIAEFYSLNIQLLSMAVSIHSYFIQQPKNKIFTFGTVIIINNELYRNVPAVYLRFVNIERSRKIECVPLIPPAKTTIDEAYPFYEWNLPKNGNFSPSSDVKIVQIEVEHVLAVTTVFVPIRFSIMGIPSSKNLRDLACSASEALQKVRQTIRQREADYAANCKDIDLMSILVRRAQLAKDYWSFQCINCPNHISHYAKYHIQRSLAERLAEIQFQLTDNSLTMLPEYKQRIDVLKVLHCIDEEENVLLKGRVASEFNTVDELIATELIFENMFKEYNSSEIIAFLSCLVFQEKSKSSSEIKLPPNPNPSGPIKATDFQHLLDEKEEYAPPTNLQRGKEMLIQVATRLAVVQKEAGLPIDEESYLEGLKWGMLQVVYEWANGVSFAEITKITDIAEGSIVRCIVRLDETAREVKNAARIIGDTELLHKMEEASTSIKRDICFASSLYF